MQTLKTAQFTLVFGGGKDSTIKVEQPPLVTGECLLATTGMMISALGGPISFISGLITAVSSCLLKD
ncbi:hypothetical protein [Psychrosphaera algicola]|uniref:Uncharacterized protein n=1 Tax=Psychrosphaera algicola TaxID=3023714 RepID=A0ABT5FCE2_9GAMM|nr:hypothetical protein [Psychrosphaera sp. G1-22]MDC2889193.1 hypothetical protein [Psychrosphaera sp. G1-22]